ncbi:MAG TPA: DUF6531 domain-containing protein [Acidimicrobiales bacterium]|nr:DUF6531 domain-containing protein [Acidimicrobiales bacterium]
MSDISVYSEALPPGVIAEHYQAAGGVLPLSYANLMGESNPSMSCYSCSAGTIRQQIGAPVNAQTGNFSHSFDDIGLPGRGPELGVSRTYNSLAAVMPDEGSSAPEVGFGSGWSWNYGSHLVFDATAPVPVDPGDPSPDPETGPNLIGFVQENGSEVLFSQDGTGAWVSPSNVFATLAHNLDGSWTVVRADTATFTFDADGRLIGESDRNGYQISLSWPSSFPGAVVVTGASGATLSIEVNGDGLVTLVTDSVGRSVSYGYADWILRSVSSLAGGSWTYSYGPGDLMTSMTDPFGGTVANSYDGMDRVVAQWGPVAAANAVGEPSDTASATTFDYSILNETTITDPTGRIERQTFRQGYLVSDTIGTGAGASTSMFEYDAVTSGQARMTDASENVTETTYFEQGWIKSTTDGAGNTTNFGGYNAFGEPGTVTDPSGVTTTYSYDVHGNVTLVSTPWNTHPGQPALTHYAYDTTYPGDLLQTVEADGTVTEFSHDPATGQVTSVIGPDGETTFGYDQAGHRTWSISPAGNTAGGTPSEHRSVGVVNPAGQILESLDPLGEPVADGFLRSGTSLGISATGETWDVRSGSWAVTPGVASVTGTAGGVALATIPNPGDPSDGAVASMIVADGTSNYAGLAFRVKGADNYWFLRQVPVFGGLAMYKTVGGVTTFVAGYETGLTTGDRIMVSSVGSKIAVYRNGARLDVLGGSGEVTDTDLDTFATTGLIGFSAGPVASGFSNHTPSGGVTDAWFDEAGRVLKTAGPRLVASGEEITRVVYDAGGRAVKTTDANGHATASEYDLAGRVVTQRVGVTGSDPNGSGSTSYAYDSQGRVASTQAGGKPAVEFVYTDASGSNPATRVVTEPSGATVTTVFDTASRPSRVTYSDATPMVSFTYDENGRVTSEDSAGSGADVVSSYDSLGQVASVTRAQRLVRYIYDRPGRISKIKYPFGNVITRGYDPKGRWDTVTDWNGQTTSFAYDADGNIAAVTTPNGVIATRSHDANGAIDHISIDDATTSIADWEYARDQAQNLTGVSATGVGGNHTWDYDAAGNLTNQAGTPAESYAYDPSNQPVTVGDTAQAFDASGEICWTSPIAAAGAARDCSDKPSGGASFHYNDNGQRTGEGATGLYHWNAAGQLTWSGRHVATAYRYDPAGLRTQATYNGSYHRYS